jgi:hypothetical protein
VWHDRLGLGGDLGVELPMAMVMSVGGLAGGIQACGEWPLVVGGVLFGGCEGRPPLCLAIILQLIFVGGG